MQVDVQFKASGIFDRFIFPFQLLFMGLAFLIFGRVAMTIIKSKDIDICIVSDVNHE